MSSCTQQVVGTQDTLQQATRSIESHFDLNGNGCFITSQVVDASGRVRDTSRNSQLERLVASTLLILHLVDEWKVRLAVSTRTDVKDVARERRYRG